MVLVYSFELLLLPYLNLKNSYCIITEPGHGVLFLISCGSVFVEGETHPKVGVILTSMALMYRRKAIEEKSSSLVVQEVRTL
jgi:hypothetical protein